MHVGTLHVVVVVIVIVVVLVLVAKHSQINFSKILINNNCVCVCVDGEARQPPNFQSSKVASPGVTVSLFLPRPYSQVLNAGEYPFWPTSVDSRLNSSLQSQRQHCHDSHLCDGVWFTPYGCFIHKYLLYQRTRNVKEKC